MCDRRDMSIAIRDYDPGRDADALRACFVELQEYERRLDPTAPPGEQVADSYLVRMWERCASWAGRVFVAASDAELVGFATVWSRVPPQEPDDPPLAYAYVSDLVVLPAWRGRGVGRALLARAEAFAREQGAPWLGIGVMAENDGARRLYERLGFAAFHVEMKKPLA
jgi:ribosomal protein S18 acetylase RimI-like enzyme